MAHLIFVNFCNSWIVWPHNDVLQLIPFVFFTILLISIRTIAPRNCHHQERCTHYHKFRKFIPSLSYESYQTSSFLSHGVLNENGTGDMICYCCKNPSENCTMEIDKWIDTHDRFLIFNFFLTSAIWIWRIYQIYWLFSYYFILISMITW